MYEGWGFGFKPDEMICAGSELILGSELRVYDFGLSAL